jgi:hypothetical protein
MIYNDLEKLTNLYSQMLTEAHDVMTNKGRKKCECAHAAKGCDCDGCEDCRCNRETVEESKKKPKPDYLDADDDGNKKESMKKALKDKKLKENSKFKNLFLSVMNEATVCGTKINSQHQYNCVTKDGEEKVLKGESVIKMKDKLKSVKAAHKKED